LGKTFLYSQFGTDVTVSQYHKNRYLQSHAITARKMCEGPQREHARLRKDSGEVNSRRVHSRLCRGLEHQPAPKVGLGSGGGNSGVGRAHSLTLLVHRFANSANRKTYHILFYMVIYKFFFPGRVVQAPMFACFRAKKSRATIRAPIADSAGRLVHTDTDRSFNQAQRFAEHIREIFLLCTENLMNFRLRIGEIRGRKRF